MSSRRLKSRPALSCRRCRERKVKCDRVKPCKACCVHGQPSECVYDEDGEDRVAIAQASEIERLRGEVAELRKRLASSQADSEVSSQVGRLSDQEHPRLSITPSSDGVFSAASGHTVQAARDVQLLASMRRYDSNSPSTILPFQPSLTLNLLWANFLDRFIDKTCPPSMNGEDNWLRSLALASSGSELLSNAFCVASFFHCGAIHSNKELEIEGRRMYGKVLRDLQAELNDKEKFKQPHVLYTLLVLGIHEVLFFQHPTAWLAHISGAGKLLQLREPRDFAYGLERETFLHFRLFDLSLNIFRRQRTFLSSNPWKTKHLDANDTSEDIIESLVDQLVELPGIFADADVLAAKLASDSISADEAKSLRDEFWDSLDKFEGFMEEWAGAWITPWPGVHCRPVQATDPACVRDPELFYRSLWYSDYRVARAVCLYASGRLLLSRVDRRPHRPTAETLEQLAMLICKSSNYLLAVTNDYLSGMNMLFSLRVAYFSFAESSQGRVWIQDVLWHISARFDMSFALQFTTALPGVGQKLSVA